VNFDQMAKAFYSAEASAAKAAAPPPKRRTIYDVIRDFYTERDESGPYTTEPRSKGCQS